MERKLTTEDLVGEIRKLARDLADKSLELEKRIKGSAQPTIEEIKEEMATPEQLTLMGDLGMHYTSGVTLRQAQKLIHDELARKRRR